MTHLKIEKDIILKRLDGIEGELNELIILKKQSFEEFDNGYGWKLTQFHLYRSLEGVFNIGSHILSRIPGATATQYKEIALKLGENKIVPDAYAKDKLVNMGKYRNRLAHFYAQITKKELYDLLQNNLVDFDIFLNSIKKVLKNPSEFNLEAE